MKCTNCGNDISYATKFCSECGTKVEPLEETPALELPFGADSLSISKLLADISFADGPEQKVVVEGPEHLKQTVKLQKMGTTATLSGEIPVTDETSPFGGGGMTNVSFGSNIVINSSVSIGNGGGGFSEINGALYFENKKVDFSAGKLSITIYVAKPIDVNIESVAGDIHSEAVLADVLVESLHGSVTFSDLNSLDLDMAGGCICQVGNVAEDVELDFSGSVTITLGNIGGDFEVDTSGNCRVSANSVSGDINVDMSGAGIVEIKSGTSGRFKADLAGAAKALHYGTVSRLDGDVSGVGRVWAAACTGKVKKDVSGMGSVSVG